MPETRSRWFATTIKSKRLVSRAKPWCKKKNGIPALFHSKSTGDTCLLEMAGSLCRFYCCLLSWCKARWSCHRIGKYTLRLFRFGPHFGITRLVYWEEMKWNYPQGFYVCNLLRLPAVSQAKFADGDLCCSWCLPSSNDVPHGWHLCIADLLCVTRTAWSEFMLCL